jgi:hypothetical protein
MNLIASLMIGYGKIFRSKNTIKKESRNDTPENVQEEKHSLKIALLKLVHLVLLLKFGAVQ